MSAGITIQNSNTVDTRSFRVVIAYSEEDKVYYASVPSLEGCMTYGDTVDEAMKNIREATEGVVAAMLDQGWAIPDDSQTLEYNLQIPLATH